MKVGAVSANIIEKNGKFLLIQEKKRKAYGLWNLPAGRLLKIDENVIDNAVKEAKEETGLKVKLTGLVGVYQHKHQKIKKTIIVFVFSTKLLGGKIKIPKNEILQAKWLTFAEIKRMAKKMRSPFILESIKDYRKGRILPLNTIKILGD